MFAAGLATLAGLSQAGMWAYSELTAPVRAESVAVSEAHARGIEWPLELTQDNGQGAWYFTYCNPDAKSDTVQITVIRDRAGKWVAKLSEKDQEKWPRLDAASR